MSTSNTFYDFVAEQDQAKKKVQQFITNGEKALNLTSLNLTTLEGLGIPDEIQGDFNCSFNHLTSLEGAPRKVSGHFKCDNNKLTSLEHAPQTVGGDFNCSFNHLADLEGAPRKIRKNFACCYNKFTSLQGAPETVGGDFDCRYNYLTSLEGAPEIIEGKFFGPSKFNDEYYRKYSVANSLNDQTKQVFRDIILDV